MGSRFRWRNAGVPLHSTVQACAPGIELTWTGQAAWISAIHQNVVEPASAGACSLASRESMSGAGVRWMMPSQRLTLQLQAFVAAIAAEAVRRCG